jgi:RimJ/RimL family protein N-acetyltransferase
VYCAYFDGNERSRKVQEKCGFTYHHTNRRTRLLPSGETRTEHVNVITFEQWRDKIL